MRSVEWNILEVLYIFVVNVFMSGFLFKNTKKKDIGITDSRCLDKGCVKKNTNCLVRSLGNSVHK